MQLMQWLPGKWRAMDSSSAAWKLAASKGPPPQRLPIMPTPAWQSTFTPVMPAPASQNLVNNMLHQPQHGMLEHSKAKVQSGQLALFSRVDSLQYSCSAIPRGQDKACV